MRRNGTCTKFIYCSVVKMDAMGFLILLVIFPCERLRGDLVPLPNCTVNLPRSELDACKSRGRKPRCTITAFSVSSNQGQPKLCRVENCNEIYIEAQLEAGLHEFEIDFQYRNVHGGVSSLAMVCKRKIVEPVSINVTIQDYLRAIAVVRVTYAEDPWLPISGNCRGKLNNFQYRNCRKEFHSDGGVKHNCEVHLAVGDNYTFKEYQLGPREGEISGFIEYVDFKSFSRPVQLTSLEWQWEVSNEPGGIVYYNATAHAPQVSDFSSVEIGLYSVVDAYYLFNTKFLPRSRALETLFDDNGTENAVLRSSRLWFRPVPGVMYQLGGWIWETLTYQYSTTLIAYGNLTRAPLAPQKLSAQVEVTFQYYQFTIGWGWMRRSHCDSVSIWVVNNNTGEEVGRYVIYNITRKMYWRKTSFPESSISGGLHVVYAIAESFDKASPITAANITIDGPRLISATLISKRTHVGHQLSLTWHTLVRPTRQMVIICTVSENPQCESSSAVNGQVLNQTYKWMFEKRYSQPLAPGVYFVTVDSYNGEAKSSTSLFLEIEIHNCLLDLETSLKISTRSAGEDIIIEDGKEYQMDCGDQQETVGVNGSNPVWKCIGGNWVSKAQCKGPSAPANLSAQVQTKFQHYRIIMTWRINQADYCGRIMVWLVKINTKEEVERFVISCTGKQVYSVDRRLPESSLEAGLYLIHGVTQFKGMVSNESSTNIIIEAPKVMNVTTLSKKTHLGHKLWLTWYTLIRPSKQQVTLCLNRPVGGREACSFSHAVHEEALRRRYRWTFEGKYNQPLTPGDYYFTIYSFGADGHVTYGRTTFHIGVHNCLLNTDTYLQISTRYIGKEAMIIEEGKEYTIDCAPRYKAVGLKDNNPVWKCVNNSWVSKAVCKGPGQHWINIVIICLVFAVLAIFLTVIVIFCIKRTEGKLRSLLKRT